MRASLGPSVGPGWPSMRQVCVWHGLDLLPRPRVDQVWAWASCMGLTRAECMRAYSLGRVWALRPGGARGAPEACGVQQGQGTKVWMTSGRSSAASKRASLSHHRNAHVYRLCRCPDLAGNFEACRRAPIRGRPRRRLARPGVGRCRPILDRSSAGRRPNVAQHRSGLGRCEAISARRGANSAQISTSLTNARRYRHFCARGGADETLSLILGFTSTACTRGSYISP